MTPLRPRRVSLRRNSVQIGSRLGGADLHAQHLPATVAVDTDGDDHGDGDDPAAAADLQVGGIDPQIWPVALDRPISSHSRLTWLLEMPLMPMALTSTERVEIPCT